MTREAIVARGLRLEYITVAWNALEALVALAAGVIAGSIALVGFGTDSVVEVSSAGVLLWRLHSDYNDVARERNEKLAQRLVGVSFLLLAVYVGVDAGSTLLRHDISETSLPGIVLACASLIVMPLLARAKRRVAQDMHSEALRADSRQTDLCAYLSAILLGGLVLNAALGWWWADPLAALLMVPLIAKEGITGLQGKSCCNDGCLIGSASSGRN